MGEGSPYVVWWSGACIVATGKVGVVGISECNAIEWLSGAARALSLQQRFTLLQRRVRSSMLRCLHRLPESLPVNFVYESM